MSQASSGLSVMAHGAGEAKQGAADSDAGGADGGLARKGRDLGVVEPELDSRDDQFAIGFAQPLQRFVIPRGRLAADRELER